MGHTYSWRRKTELPATPFALATEDCGKLISLIGIPVAGFDGTGEPIVQGDMIIFNGQAPAACEPFELHQTEFDLRGRDTFRRSCKTNHAPYTIVVQCCLISLKHHLGSAIEVTGDGSDSDWDDARRACQETLQYGADFRRDPP